MNIMLERAQSPCLDKATIALCVTHERFDLLRAIWENPVFPLLCIEDPYIFGACSRNALQWYLESMPGIPDEVLRLWLVAFPLDDDNERRREYSVLLWAHVGHYHLRGNRPLWRTFAISGSHLEIGIKASHKLLGWERLG